MLVTNNKKLYLKALKISNQGRNYKTIDNLGVKYKMSNIQAALARSVRKNRCMIALKEEFLDGIINI